MYCAKCGKQLSDKDQFCDKCGTPTTKLKSEGMKKEKSSNGFTRKWYFLFCVIAIVVVVVIAIVVIKTTMTDRNKENNTTEVIIEEDTDKAVTEKNTAEPVTEKNTEEVVTEKNSELYVNDDVINVSTYLEDWKPLVQVLEMKKTDSWQFGGTDSYEVDGFYLEYMEGSTESIFSMKNDENMNISLHGIKLNDSIEDANDILLGEGWTKFYQNEEISDYGKIINGDYYYVGMIFSSEQKLNSWYLCNWPEGEDVYENYMRIEMKMYRESGLEWKALYMEYILDHQEYVETKYELVYINDDDIPELMANHGSSAGGGDVFTILNGQVESVHTSCGISYMERENLFCDAGGRMDVYYDKIYTIGTNAIVELYQGNYGAEDNSNVQKDENGYPIYHYFWQDKEVSEEEYERKLFAVYDRTKAVDLYPDVYYGWEMIEKIKEF